MNVLNVRLRNGVYIARVHAEGATDPDTAPDLVLRVLGDPVDEQRLYHEGGEDWSMEAPIPLRALSDGVQCYVLTTGDGAEVLHSLPIAVGASLEGDLTTEVAMLRAELDLLKRAFRRKLSD